MAMSALSALVVSARTLLREMARVQFNMPILVPSREIKGSENAGRRHQQSFVKIWCHHTSSSCSIRDIQHTDANRLMTMKASDSEQLDRNWKVRPSRPYRTTKHGVNWWILVKAARSHKRSPKGLSHVAFSDDDLDWALFVFWIPTTVLDKSDGSFRR